MRNSTWCASVLGIALLLLMSVGNANAQATRTWVSGVGDDANPCSRTAPCKTFAGAISKTAAGGEISTLDPGGYGAVTITKSISITNDGSGEAGILASSTTGIIVNAAATDIVKLKGLVIDGAPPSTPGLHGIRFIAGAQLHVEDCVIKNFTGAGNGNGIIFAPGSGTAHLFVSNSTIQNNGNASTGSGIVLQPTGSATAFAVLSKVNAQGNRQGLRAESTQTTGTASLVIRDSVIAGSGLSGVSAASKLVSPTSASVLVENSAVVNNPAALAVNGPTAEIIVSNSTIYYNTNAATFVNSGGVFSYKNNRIDGNTTNNTPLPQVNLN